MRALMVFFLFLFFALPSGAASPSYKPLPSLQTIEGYLQGLSTLQARFIQTGPDGTQVSGKFMLKRPGRLRFEYDPPVTDFIVADGTFVYYYDGQLKEQSSTLITRSLADFFLRKDLQLSGDVSVSDIKRDGGFLQVTLVQTEDPLAGSLTLGIAENEKTDATGLALKKWRIVDATGLVTEVELFEIERGIRLDNDLFHYYKPKGAREKFN